jgi:hypothetical protein
LIAGSGEFAGSNSTRSSAPSTVRCAKFMRGSKAGPGYQART